MRSRCKSNTIDLVQGYKKNKKKKKKKKPVGGGGGDYREKRVCVGEVEL